MRCGKTEKGKRKRSFIGIDDTDTIDADRGSGKLARWLSRRLPAGCRVTGVVRQQLLVSSRIPYTSHNSSACVIVAAEDAGLKSAVIDAAADHLRTNFIPGSDPGLCVAVEAEACNGVLEAFGRICTSRVMTQAEALTAVGAAHLSGHGGTCDGIIGAAAAVGLTASGWYGRFIDYGNLRDLPDETTVDRLVAEGVEVVSIDRNAVLPSPRDRVRTNGWFRPRLIGHRAVLLVAPDGAGGWANNGAKRRQTAAHIPPAGYSDSACSASATA